MSTTVNGDTYLDTQEVRELFNASKQMFYTNIQPRLQVHRFGARRKPWYRQRDVEALLMGKSVRKASISLSGGMQQDWTRYLEAQGFHAETIDCSIEVVPLPADVPESFHLPTSALFVKRQRKTLANGVPICVWDTYYPLELVEGGILEDMKHFAVPDVVARIKAEHGVIISHARDKYTARLATLPEQELLDLVADEAVLILQRASYTRARELVLYSDMVLLGNWFAPEHEYAVHLWDE